MSKRMENYLDFAESLAPAIDPETVEFEPKKYLLTWLGADDPSAEKLKTFDTIEDLKKYVEEMYNPWLTPKTILNLDTNKKIEWALGIDDMSQPGKNIFVWGIEE